MMKFIWFCAAGYSFFVGAALLTCGMLFPAFQNKTWRRLTIYALAIIAAFLIFLSATPLPWWFYTIWTVLLLGSLFMVSLPTTSTSKSTIAIRIAAGCLSVIALLAELPYQLVPSLPKREFEKVYVIGDSVSAGIAGEKEQTWPKILRKDYGVNLVDLSEPGATVRSAMRRAAQVECENAVVLLEIGGNDILGTTPTTVFEKELEQLIKKVSHPNRLVVMLELPVPPWRIGYSGIQRQLARELNIVLIPKRFFVSVLAAPGTTVDLAHLSPTGHKLMAEKIWCLVGNSAHAATIRDNNQDP